MYGMYDKPSESNKPPLPEGKPDGSWTPDPSSAQQGDPWDPLKGSDPPFPEAAKVPGGAETPGKGVNVISVDAINTYAVNIETLLPVITSSIKELDDLAASGFGAGNFGAANNFKAKVFGGSGGQGSATLLASTRAVFVEAETIIKEIAARCREIAQKYKTASELAELDAKEFTEMVSTVKAKVDNLPLGGAS
ncbi:hypothetical protein C8D88_10832 [Lentzea atacamensis]|uniref:Uncharacterized protein n=1 Tax=Lentzea atacamensis TaxID=531938 RepID=A0A316HVH2_9PSEU|nr:hypothetical protein [Lentzea atacamensis]PWK84417.1 hypothetical protein C8D88_10832 [Lentzea atacamensis]